MTPAKRRESNRGAREIETIVYSPKKRQKKRADARLARNGKPEFEEFQKSIRSKFGYSLRKKMGDASGAKLI